jgi:hypothetical protein
MEKERKVIIGRELICKAYGFGKRTFYWLKDEKKAPIDMVGGRFWVHRDTFDEFLRNMLIETRENGKKRR